MQTKRLLLAGSHGGTTAISVVEEIKKRNLNWEIHWLGQNNKDLSSLEVISHIFESGKIENKFTKNTIPKILMIPLDFIRTPFLLLKIRPDLVLNFGSAVGGLISFWSWVFNIPVIVHEQTTVAGRANIISSYFAKVVAISRESSKKYFKGKLELTGNPINKQIVVSQGKSPNEKVKTILFTGGSRGSVWINNALKPILSRLLKKYYVILQAGEAHLSQITNHNPRLLVFGQTDTYNMAKILSKADIVVSRAGANTVSELIALKKPSILIPIPWSYLNEQTENARYMENLGLARILPQKTLTAQKLLFEIDAIVKNYSAILKHTENIISPDLHASEKVVDILQSYLKG